MYVLAMSNPENTHEKIIAISIRVLRIKTGMVIFVGIAARLVTKLAPIAVKAAIKRNMLLPAKRTAMIVIGVMMQPCVVSTIPSQSKRFFSWPWHQIINFLNKETLCSPAAVIVD